MKTRCHHIVRVFITATFFVTGHLTAAATVTPANTLPSCEDAGYTAAQIQTAVSSAFKRMESEGHKVTPLLWENEKEWGKVFQYVGEILKCNPSKPGTKPLAAKKITSLPCPLSVARVREACHLDSKLAVSKNEKTCEIITGKSAIPIVTYSRAPYDGDFKKFIQGKTRNGSFSYQQISGLGQHAIISGGIPVSRAPKQRAAIFKEYEKNGFSLAIIKGKEAHTFHASGPEWLKIMLRRPVQGCSIEETKALAKKMLGL